MQTIETLSSIANETGTHKQMGMNQFDKTIEELTREETKTTKPCFQISEDVL